MSLSEDIVCVRRLGIKQEVLLVFLIMLAGAVLRLFAFIEISDGTLRFVGTCGQLLDEAQPLFDSKNPLHFEVFFYPPVAPILVASTGLIAASISHGPLNFAVYCLLFSIGISLATVVVVYFIGKDWSTHVGLVACSLYAVSMIAIDCANTVQAYATFFSMLALYMFYRSLRTPSVSNLAFMGICLGLGVASKYFPLMLSGMLVLLSLQYVSSRDERATQISGSSGNREKANLVCNAIVWTMLVISLITLCFGLLYREVVVSTFQSIYDAHPHDHPFQYHLPLIKRLYMYGLLTVGSAGAILGVLLYLSYRSGMSLWAWISELYHIHWRWLVPCFAMIITTVLMVGIPAGLNLNNYLKYTVYITKSYGSADSGFFPAGSPAPSYLLSYFPENLGLPLFLLSCIGIAYCLYARDRKGILLFVIGMPLYMALEFSAVKVNRFALDLMPILCLFAGVFVVALSRHSLLIIRALALVTFLFVFCYSAVYSLAWAKFERLQQSVPGEAAGWIKANIATGTRIGMNAELWLSGSPHLLPDPHMLDNYEIAKYTAYPEIIVLPKGVYEIVRQYAKLTQSGYVYQAEDWSPHRPPALDEMAVFLDLVNEDSYELIKEIEEKPSFGKLTFDAEALTGKTWFREHAGPYGIRIYRKRSASQHSSLDNSSWGEKDGRHV
jgi:hypothetical protein